MRYGTKAGCDVHRYNADELESAISAAMLDFYRAGNDLITKAVAEFQDQYATSSRERQTQLSTITRELREVSASIDRYLIAFEKGTLDDDDANVRARLASLKEQSKELRTRKAQLEFELDQPPRALSPADLDTIREQIRQIVANGEPPIPAFRSKTSR